VVDRAIDAEEEPAAVWELEFVTPEPSATPGGGARWRLADELIIHRDLLSRDSTPERSVVRSARQLALGRRSGERADPGKRLMLGEATALRDLDRAPRHQRLPGPSRPPARSGQ